MLTDGVEELHADSDRPTSAAGGRRVVVRPAKDDPAAGSIDRAAAPFFVRIHSTIQAARAPSDVDRFRGGSLPITPDSGSGQDVRMDADFRADLCAAGLDSVKAVMASREGRCMRVLADRENWRLELTRRDGGSRGVFLKKHHVRTRLSRFRALFGLDPGQTAGRVEAENVGRLATIGIASMRVAAWGERLHPDGRLESYLMTEELEGYRPLEQFFAEPFGQLEAHSGATRNRDLRRLIRLVADIARRFHGAGYNHRDFYCCHFFVKESSSGRFDVRLIDLQRVQHRIRFRRRWLVKDLAQLSYSASRRHIKCAHRMAFMRRYLGVKKLRPRHKRLIRRVLAKQRLMEWKLGVVE